VTGTGTGPAPAAGIGIAGVRSTLLGRATWPGTNKEFTLTRSVQVTRMSPTPTRTMTTMAVPLRLPTPLAVPTSHPPRTPPTHPSTTPTRPMSRTATPATVPRQEALRPWRPAAQATPRRDPALLHGVREDRPPATPALRRQGGTRRPADSPLTM
jgi:hypothetical protein